MKFINKKTKISLIVLGSLVLLSGFYVASAAVLRIVSTSSNNFQIPDIEKGLVAHYSLAEEDLKSASVIADITPNNRDGTVISGDPTNFTTDQRGVTNQAYDFKGSTDRILLSSPFGQSGSSTISLWYKRSTSGSATWRTLLGHATANIHHLIVQTPGTGPIGIFDGSFRSFGYTPPDDGLFHNYTVIYNSAATAILYVDGVYVNQIAIVLNLATNPIGSIGNWNTGTYWAGPISDVRIYDRALSVGEVQQLYQSYRPSMIVSDLEKGLIARFPLDAETKQSATTFIDTTPNARIGTITVGASTGLQSDRSGVATKAYDFDGSATYINLSPSNVVLPNPSTVTISLWAKIDTLTGNRYLFSTRRAATGSYLSLRIPGNIAGKMGWVHPNGTGVLVGDGSTTLSAGQWYHFVFVKNGNSNIGYVNGVEDYNFSAAYSVSPSTDTAAIGAFNGASFFDGSISDVQIYNRAFSASEVAQLYQTYQ